MKIEPRLKYWSTDDVIVYKQRKTRRLAIESWVIFNIGIMAITVQNIFANLYQYTEKQVIQISVLWLLVNIGAAVCCYIYYKNESISTDKDHKRFAEICPQERARMCGYNDTKRYERMRIIK